MNLLDEHEIVVEHITQDIEEWLEETCPGRFFITPNMIRFRYAGPTVTLSKCERREGMKIVFENKKELLLFKVAWG